MRILGVHIGHNATACLYEDGRIVAMLQEEWFTRKRNQSGFPRRAVEWLMEEYHVGPEDLDRVAVAGLGGSMENGNSQQRSWESVAPISQFAPRRAMTSWLVHPYLAAWGFGRSAVRHVARCLSPFGIPADRIRSVDHHTCHAHAAYWLDSRRNGRSTLVITLDNTDVGLSGTVSVVTADAEFKRVKRHQSLRSVGMLYAAITRYLGMKPVQDEHKVMALAMYARSAQALMVYEILRSHLNLSADGLEFVNRTGFGERAYTRLFQKELAGFRFDNVAGGVQRLVEELVTNYIRAWSRHTGLRKVVVGGDVFMNVQMNRRINELEDFEDFFFLPSCGDEHNAAGAALKCAYDLCRQQGRSFDPEPLGPLYLGPDYASTDVETVLDEYVSDLHWRRSPDVDCETAELVAAGRIVGRMCGRMEFGARALGNRSILARADSLSTLHRINAAIKMRDFWMPLAPAILWERRHDYVINPKDSSAPYMMLAFQSTPKARTELIAGLHPFDLSCQPQMVEHEWNPRFHRLLTYYQELTGSAGVINTSFNLYGEPVVCTPQDAIQSYLQSDLDVLILEDYVIWDDRRRDRAIVSEGEIKTSRIAREMAGTPQDFANSVFAVGS